MSQYDVYKNTGRLQSLVPYILDIQSNLVSNGLSTKIIVPLYKRSELSTLALKIHVATRIKNSSVVALFDEMTSIESKKLTDPICNLELKHGDDLRKALDVMFFNFP